MREIYLNDGALEMLCMFVWVCMEKKERKRTEQGGEEVEEVVG